MRLEVELPDDFLEAIAARAADLVSERLESEPASPYLSIPEAAEYLRSSRQRVYDLLSSGRLTRFKDGARVLVSRVELDRYLAGEGRNGVAPSLPPAQQRGTASRVAR